MIVSQCGGALVASVGVATRHSGGTELGCIGRGFEAGGINGGGGAVGAGGVMTGAVGGGVGATCATDVAASIVQPAIDTRKHIGRS